MKEGTGSKTKMALTCVEERKGLSYQQDDRDESKRKETCVEDQNEGWKDCISGDSMQKKNNNQNVIHDRTSLRRIGFRVELEAWRKALKD